ncbi:MAG: hypothetical protein RLY93_00810 [Sumerlaeia bacterium]
MSPKTEYLPDTNKVAAILAFSRIDIFFFKSIGRRFPVIQPGTEARR